MHIQPELLQQSNISDNCEICVCQFHLVGYAGQLRPKKKKGPARKLSDSMTGVLMPVPAMLCIEKESIQRVSERLGKAIYLYLKRQHA